MLDTDQLRSFLAIVDTGSFTKAAECVHKTQSAVSMHIRRLEEQLGCALFVKQGRGQARNSGRLRRIVPGRDSLALQSAPSLGRGLGRLRSLARTCGAGGR